MRTVIPPRLFALTAAISLLLCAASAALWVRSYRFPENRAGESLNFRRNDPRWWVISHRGTFTLCRQNGKEWGREFGNVEGLGFSFGGLRGSEGSLWNLQVPYWFATATLLVPPVLWIVRSGRRRKRSRAGLCRRCGYDLRASGGVCPECGARVKEGAVAA
jgi:hypothetical protein